MSMDINTGVRLADELTCKIGEESDNLADALAGIAVAIRRLQGYSEYLMLSTTRNLRAIDTDFMKGEQE